MTNIVNISTAPTHFILLSLSVRTVCEDQKLSARNGGASYNLYKLRSESRKAEYRVTSHGSVSTSEVIPDGVLLECKVCPQSRNKNLIQTTCALWFCDTGYVRTRKHKNYQFTRILNLSTDACTPVVWTCDRDWLPTHLFQMKKAVINTMFCTPKTVCSGPEERRESLTSLR
ncbi:hypothetical protein RB195_023906 [Necator americanus]|uniref:Uncharacterized protein n=1 Tax=Necator americanus TaxID=51031 RepID=A0ABR1EL25_NECAM